MEENDIKMIPVKIGQILKGIVSAIRKEYIEVQVGELLCILPKTEVSINKKTKLKKDEEIQVVVILITNQGIVVSVKRMIYYFHVGQKMSLPIVRIAGFGLFFNLVPHLSGLLHISKMSKGGLNDVRDTFNVGDVVESEIDDINYKEGKISLKTIETIK